MKKRLDILVFDKGLTESREKAQRLIMAGQVLAEGKIELKPGTKFEEDIEIEILEKDPYVGRGAYKLKGAHEYFNLDFKNKTIADIGSSTGGFTDYALQNGALKVYAIDVGRGQLDWKLRNDPRVVVMEKTNFRDIKELPEKIDMFVIDVSFVSIKRILENIKKNWSKNKEIEIIALFKPQFEVGKDIADKFKGIIKDPEIHNQLLEEFRSWCDKNDFSIIKESESPIEGAEGNKEFLFFLKIKS